MFIEGDMTQSAGMKHKEDDAFRRELMGQRLGRSLAQSSSRVIGFIARRDNRECEE